MIGLIFGSFWCFMWLLKGCLIPTKDSSHHTVPIDNKNWLIPALLVWVGFSVKRYLGGILQAELSVVVDCWSSMKSYSLLLQLLYFQGNMKFCLQSHFPFVHSLFPLVCSCLLLVYSLLLFFFVSHFYLHTLLFVAFVVRVYLNNILFIVTSNFFRTYAYAGNVCRFKLHFI